MMKKISAISRFMICFACLMLIFVSQTAVAGAETKDFVLSEEDEGDATLTVGDTGTFQFINSEYIVESVCFTSSNPAVLTIDSTTGEYKTLSAGFAFVETVVQYQYVNSYFDTTYTLTNTMSIYVRPDMTKVSLSKKSITLYQEYNKWYNPESSFTLKVNGFEGMNSNSEVVSFSYRLSGTKVSVRDCYITDGQLYVTLSGTGSTTLTLTINGVEFSLKVKLISLRIKEGNSLILQKGKTKTLHLKGIATKDVTWKSTNAKVISVSSKGKIKAKKYGNAVVYMKKGDLRIGIAVSSVTSKRYKVLKYATYIGTHWKYSQAKRMSKGYYDCSALVWKAYSKYEKKYFGMRFWAPTAADNAKYMAKKHKMIKGNCYKKLQKMKITPGATLYKTGSNNGRYKGIYHVEMFTGYTCEGFDGSKPIIGTKWAARPDNYASGMEGIMAQP